MKRQFTLNCVEIMHRCDLFLASRGLDTKREFEEICGDPPDLEHTAPVLAEPNANRRSPWER